MNEREDFDAQWSARAGRHNPPPPAPRDEMWAAIKAARVAGPVQPEPKTPTSPLHAPRRVRPAVWWVTGIAAAAVLGAVLGRWTAPENGTGPLAARGPAEPGSTVVARADQLPPKELPDGVGTVPPATQPSPRPSPRVGAAAAAPATRDGDRGAPNRAYRVAAAQHLAMTEALLVTLRADLQAGRQDSTVAKWATGLLSTTRLMMDSPASQDPQLRRLLEDLELVLVQIARLQAATADTTELRIIDEAVRRRQVLTRLRAMAPGA